VRQVYKLRVFEKREPRKLYGPKKDEVTGKRRRLHSGDFHNFYSPPDIICMIKSRRMGQSWHFRPIGREKVHTEIWLKSQKERDHLVDSDTDRRILKKIDF
jgi:hypothetical protein